MKKSIKSILVCLIIFFLLTLNACNYTSIKKEKNNNQYYFSKLANNITTCNNYKITLLDTNFYKTIELNKTDINTLLNFMNTLNKNNFIKKPIKLPKKPEYKFFLNLDENKYVINVYNEQYVSIFPWDGNYSEDFIDMKNLYKGYNLYNLCKYLIPKIEN